MKLNTGIFLLGISLLLTGCSTGLVKNGGNVPSASKMDLEGSWNFWMRMDTISDNSLVKGTMVVQDEVCRSAICDIHGIIFKPQVVTVGTQMNFRGVAIPNENLIRIRYFDENNRSEPLLVIVEFDVFLEDFSPPGTMVGSFVIFDQKAPGPLNEESSILVEADRGQVVMAGRVTAWPIVIEDPTER